jgi:hypothetical protein
VVSTIFLFAARNDEPLFGRIFARGRVLGPGLDILPNAKRRVGNHLVVWDGTGVRLLYLAYLDNFASARLSGMHGEASKALARALFHLIVRVNYGQKTFFGDANGVGLMAHRDLLGPVVTLCWGPSARYPANS